MCHMVHFFDLHWLSSHHCVLYMNTAFYILHGIKRSVSSSLICITSKHKGSQFSYLIFNIFPLAKAKCTCCIHIYKKTSWISLWRKVKSATFSLLCIRTASPPAAFQLKPTCRFRLLVDGTHNVFEWQAVGAQCFIPTHTERNAFTLPVSYFYRSFCKKQIIW